MNTQINIEQDPKQDPNLETTAAYQMRTRKKDRRTVHIERMRIQKAYGRMVQLKTREARIAFVKVMRECAKTTPLWVLQRDARIAYASLEHAFNLGAI